MAFDPDVPSQGAPNSSAEMRAQLNGLKALIDAVPAGPEGPAGPPGEPGSDGAQGPPFAQAVVDAVTTLPPGGNATVSVSFDGSNVHFDFSLPAGATGPEGPTGGPGEVSAQQLADGLLTCSANSNGVPTLNIGVSEPPTQAEVQSVVDKLNELITALRR